MISERVIDRRYGRTTRGAVVMPRNTLAEAHNDSAPATSITQTITRAITLTRNCKTWR